MSRLGMLAVQSGGEYHHDVRAMIHFFFLLLSVALLPLTSFAARAATASDLSSSALELAQSSLPKPVQKPASGHRHCTLWAAEAGTYCVLSLSPPTHFPADPYGPDALPLNSRGPAAPTPPPKS